MTPQIAVYAAAAASVFFAVLMVRQRSLYASAVCLLAVLLQAAVLFFLSGAPLLAFLQIMVYAGAVMVLIVVAIMSSGSPDSEPVWTRLSLPWPVAAMGLGLPFFELLALVARGNLPPGGLGGGLSVQAAMGSVLFGPYAPATEAVSVLLLLSSLAILGVARGGK
jgi:NADH-quinone oxidoreductase subunit J